MDQPGDARKAIVSLRLTQSRRRLISAAEEPLAVREPDGAAAASTDGFDGSMAEVVGAGSGAVVVEVSTGAVVEVVVVVTGGSTGAAAVSTHEPEWYESQPHCDHATAPSRADPGAAPVPAKADRV